MHLLSRVTKKSVNGRSNSWYNYTFGDTKVAVSKKEFLAKRTRQWIRSNSHLVVHIFLKLTLWNTRETTVDKYMDILNDISVQEVSANWDLQQVCQVLVQCKQKWQADQTNLAKSAWCKSTICSRKVLRPLFDKIGILPLRDSPSISTA